MECESPEQLYEELTRYWPANVVRSAPGSSRRSFLTADKISSTRNFIERVLLLDLGNYLPEDLLAKVDRASMAASLESRSPLLDYKIVEFASSLPTSMRAKNGERKYMLRKLLSKYLPVELYERPKMGSQCLWGMVAKGSPLLGEEKLSLLRSECGEFIDTALIEERWRPIRVDRWTIPMNSGALVCSRIGSNAGGPLNE